MSYFNQDFINFFKELAANNHKEWFDDNRKRYENNIKKPFHALVSDLITAIHKDDAKFSLEPKDAIFRINKDVRFSSDKTPYKLHLSAILSPAGRKKLDDPGMYFQLGVDESFVGGGMYCPAKENLFKMRESIVHNHDVLEKLLKNPAFTKFYNGFVEGSMNKVLPKEFKEYGSQYPLLYYKEFYFMKSYKQEDFALQENLLEVLMEHYFAGKEVNLFIRESIF